MRRVVIPEKSKLLAELSSNDSHDIVFKINPEKKAHLESLVSDKGNRVLRVLRDWMEKDIDLTKKVVLKD